MKKIGTIKKETQIEAYKPYDFENMLSQLRYRLSINN